MVTLELTDEERAILVQATLAGARPTAIRIVSRADYTSWPQNYDIYLSCGHIKQVGDRLIRVASGEGWGVGDTGYCSWCWPSQRRGDGAVASRQWQPAAMRLLSDREQAEVVELSLTGGDYAVAAPYCFTRSVRRLACTRPRGHSGPHVAHSIAHSSVMQILEIWIRGESDEASK